MSTHVYVNKQFIEGLKKAYERAVQQGASEFTYDGHQFITSYAKYFLQFHAPLFGVKLSDS